jgi:hypothetical protein
MMQCCDPTFNAGVRGIKHDVLERSHVTQNSCGKSMDPRMEAPPPK